MTQPTLTPREEQVLRHLRLGLSNKDIAATLGIGEQAVKALVSRLLAKYGAPNRTTLVSVSDKRNGGPHEHGAQLRDALQESRNLRDRNTDLMTQMRGEMREVRQLRTRMAESRSGRTARNEVKPPTRAPRTPPAR